MYIVIEPQAGDKFQDQVDLANTMLKDTFVHKVTLNFNGVLRVMTRVLSPDEIRAEILSDYKE